jgi:hypothetical protein
LAAALDTAGIAVAMGSTVADVRGVRSVSGPDMAPLITLTATTIRPMPKSA